MPTIQEREVTARLRRYLDKLLDQVTDRAADRLAPKIEERFTEELRGWVATVEVMSDEELVADLRVSDEEADEDAQPYEEVRRELGFA